MIILDNKSVSTSEQKIRCKCMKHLQRNGVRLLFDQECLTSADSKNLSSTDWTNALCGRFPDFHCNFLWIFDFSFSLALYTICFDHFNRSSAWRDSITILRGRFFSHFCQRPKKSQYQIRFYHTKHFSKTYEHVVTTLIERVYA